MKYRVIDDLEIYNSPGTGDQSDVLGILYPGFIFDAEESDDDSWVKDTNGFFYQKSSLEQIDEDANQTDQPAIQVSDPEISLNYHQTSEIPNEILHTRGEGSVIAILDTGCSPHSALENKVILTYDALSKVEAGDTPDESDSGHGTFIAGLISGEDEHFTGIAPDTKLIVVKVSTNDNNVSPDAVLHGLEWLSNCSIQPDIVNISLEFWGDADNRRQFADLFKEFRSRGTICLSGARNDHGLFSNMILYPSVEEDVIAVGALRTSILDQVTGSSLHKKVKYVVPNVKFRSTSNQGSGYREHRGCSFSTAYAAGMLSLITSYHKQNELNSGIIDLFDSQLPAFQLESFNDQLKIYRHA